jgi:hypothetical protein
VNIFEYFKRKKGKFLYSLNFQLLSQRKGNSMSVITAIIQSYTRTRVYYNSNCCPDMRATRFDLYLGHLQARQYKNKK